jgi:hypothetical protein
MRDSAIEAVQQIGSVVRRDGVFSQLVAFGIVVPSFTARDYQHSLDNSQNSSSNNDDADDDVDKIGNSFAARVLALECRVALHCCVDDDSAMLKVCCCCCCCCCVFCSTLLTHLPLKVFVEMDFENNSKFVGCIGGYATSCVRCFYSGKKQQENDNIIQIVLQHYNNIVDDGSC